MDIIKIKALWHEKKNFKLDRADTGDEYIFLHYLTPVTIFLDGMEVNVPAGSCILYDRHSHQSFIADGCELIHDWFHIRGDLDSIIQKYNFHCNTIYTVSCSREITSIIKDMESEFLIKDIFNSEITGLKFEELLLKVIRGSGKSKMPLINEDTKNRFIEARNTLNDSFNEDWSVEKMAELVSLSSSRFYKLYHDIFSISPNKDLQLIRIEHAKMLLSQNKYLIREIAELTGYNNPYHFIRQFKSITGMTPKKWSLYAAGELYPQKL